MPVSSATALAKRIKRHVTGRSQRFFAVTPPGLEDLCAKELAGPPLSIQRIKTVAGGVEFQGRLHDLYRASLFLRTASRILLRVAVFKATNFRQLERKVRAIPWELYLHPGPPPEVKVTAHHSRLYHTRAVAQRCRSAVKERFDQVQGAIAKKRSSMIYVRAVDDLFTVSLDSSGANLYLRGLKPQGGSAPLRETLAAAVLMWAGFSAARPLIDPMCGAGTFTLEACSMVLNLPAGWHRDFAFTRWPNFQAARWKFIRREAQKRLGMTGKPLILASDHDAAAVGALEKTLLQHRLSETVRVLCRDFFALEPRHFFRQPGLVVLNPPYGVRLGTPHQTANLYHDIAAKLRQSYRGWHLALVAPHIKLAAKMPCSPTYRPLMHGGLKLALLTGRIT